MEFAAAEEVSPALLSVEEADSVEVPVAVLSESEPVAVPVAIAALEPLVTDRPVAAPLITTVVLEPTETAKEVREVEFPMLIPKVVIPSGRPAGTTATAG